MPVRPHLLLAAAVGGLAVAPYLGANVSWTLAIALPVAGIAVALAERRVELGLLAIALAIGGFAVGQARLHAYDAVPQAVSRAAPFAGEGFVVERFRRSGAALRGRVAVASGPARGARLEVRLRMGGFQPAARQMAIAGFDFPIGSRLALAGRIEPVFASGRSSAHRDRAGGGRRARAGDESYRRWLRAEGVDGVLATNDVRALPGRRGGVVGAFDTIRVRAERALAVGLPAQPAALMRGMVLGGDEQFADGLRNDFRAVGLSHIVAVSGANVMLLAILVAAVCGALGVGYRVRFAIALACILIYVPLCGAGASVVRAGVMGVAALCATRVARAASRSYTLLLAALVLLLINPRACEDVGAQLSFAAVLGLMAFAAPLQRWLGFRVALPGWLAEAAAATVAATLATMPVSAFHFGNVSLIALVANVLAAPVIGPIVWLGSVAAAIGQLAIWPATLLNATAGFMLAFLIELARALAGVPGAQVTVHVGLAGLVTSALLLALAALATAHRAPLRRAWSARTNKRRPGRPAFGRSHRPWQKSASSLALGSGRGPPVRLGAPSFVLVLALAACVAGAWSLAAVGRSGRAAERPAIVFLDVGQGDSQLLIGGRGCEALIDGGPYGSDIASKLRRFGVGRLELVVASHPAADHHGGLIDMMRDGGVRVDRFLAGGLPTDDLSYAELTRLMRAQGATAGEAADGATWRCGDIALDVVGPAPARPGQLPPGDANTRAAVIEARVGATTLLTSGDAESPQLLPLALSHADVFKVPHHGSEDEGLVRVLEVVRPGIAVIQAGANNSYGHPRPDVLRALASVPTVKRTDRDGTVVVRAR